MVKLRGVATRGTDTSKNDYEVKEADDENEGGSHVDQDGSGQKHQRAAFVFVLQSV